MIMKKTASAFMLIIAALIYLAGPVVPEEKEFNLLEEDKEFWDRLLKDGSVKNKNILYASYVAYKESLNDLSIETFNECITDNSENSGIVTVANYYIGKNHYFLGNYQEALKLFQNVSETSPPGYEGIRFSAMINAAITYYQLNEIEKFKESLQKVISTDKEGKYKKIALDILSLQK